MEEKYRQAARAFEDDLNGLILKSKDLTVSEYIRNCLFALLNQKETTAEVSKIKQKKQQSTDLTQQQKDLLLNGINVKLFRTDGSNKSAIVKLNSKMTEIMAYKKGGSVKPKYQFALVDITDYKFNYADKNKVWELSTFSKAGGLFSKSKKNLKANYSLLFTGIKCTILSKFTNTLYLNIPKNQILNAV